MKNQLVNTARISISNFTFELGTYIYLVTFFSTKTNKQWSVSTEDYKLIDSVRNIENPKQKDLTRLKKLCKNGN